MRNWRLPKHPKEHTANLSTTRCTTQANDDGIKTMNIARSLKAWRQVRRTENQLSRLTARELDDLGINRGDIADIARNAYRATR